jgi:hypothetical protein
MGGLGGMAHDTKAHRYGIWTCVRGWDVHEQRRCGEALLACACAFLPGPAASWRALSLSSMSIF